MNNLQTQINTYLEHCQDQKRLDTKTIKAYRIDLKQFHNHFSNLKISDITPDMLEKYISDLHQEYKPKTVKRKIASIKALFHYLEYKETATIKDQYGDSMSTDSAKVTVLGTPNKDAKFNNTTVKAGDDVTVGFSTSDNKTFTFDGSKFDTKGTYTFKISSKNGDKTLDRTFTVNVVDKPANGVAQSYEVKVDNAEIDTTINKNGDKPSNITVNVAQMANGAAFDTVDAQYVKYVVKKGTDTIFETSGKTSAAINAGSNAAADLTIAAVSQNGVKYDKLLSAGTYNVTATFYVKTTSTGSTFSASDATDYKKVTVGGSFVIKDTQDSKVTFTIENNNLSTTVASAFENQSYVKVYYDGQLQTIASGDVIEVKGTSLTCVGSFRFYYTTE